MKFGHFFREGVHMGSTQDRRKKVIEVGLFVENYPNIVFTAGERLVVFAFQSAGQEVSITSRGEASTPLLDDAVILSEVNEGTVESRLGDDFTEVIQRDAKHMVGGNASADIL